MPLQLFDNILRWQGFPIQEAKSRFKQLLNNTDESIEQHKKAIVQHHLKHNNFYINLLDNKSTDWAKLPVLTKRDLQQPLHKRLSNDYSSKKRF